VPVTGALATDMEALMPGRGPAPAESHTRSRNDKQTTQLVSDGKKRGPNLPQLRLNGKLVPWHPQTKKWWASWRTSPQALRMMTAPDWEYLLVTARVHHEFWSSGRWELAAELRLREAKFGATPEDRSRLRVEIGTGLPNATPGSTVAASAGNVTSIDADRRKRVSSAAG
jgi:hypothetical protein